MIAGAVGERGATKADNRNVELTRVAVREDFLPRHSHADEEDIGPVLIDFLNDVRASRSIVDIEEAVTHFDATSLAGGPRAGIAMMTAICCTSMTPNWNPIFCLAEVRGGED